MVEPEASSKRAKSASERLSALGVRIGGGLGGGRGSGRGSGRRGRRPRGRPPGSGSGAGARMIAPLALIICAIAVFSILTSTGPKDAEGNGAAETKQSRSGGGDSSSDSGGAVSDGDRVQPGAGETGPSGPVKATYRVKPGDSFAAIAEEVGVPVDTLSELNPDVDPRALQPGQKLKLR